MPSNLFKDVHFYISKTFPVDKTRQLSRILSLNGAISTELDDERLTHYVTGSLPGHDSLEVLPSASTARLVTTQWVERSLVLGAVQDPTFHSPDPAMLFSGVIATSTGLSKTDNEVLCAGISSLGGQWRTAFTKDVTHLFAMSPNSAKYATGMHFRESTGVRVLVPHWFDDVVRLGMRNLPTEEYEWPSPKVLAETGVEAIRKLAGGDEGEEAKEAKKNKPLSPHKKALYETALVTGSDLPTQHPASNNVWDGKKILLSSSLGLKERQVEAHVADIERSGGIVVQCTQEEEAGKVEDADILITKYRAGPAYVKAYRLNKTIGALPWLWYVRATGILSRPTDQLLHYPVPIKRIDGFERHVITVTNYTGKDREYIKKLIIAMGAEFTPNMTGRNTVVIAAYVSGTKTTKAVSWSIPIVNHTWLEDSFIQWRNIPTANEKYIVFPPGVDFSTMLGEKGLGVLGYDAGELAALEKEGITQNNADNSVRAPLASQPVGESPRKAKKNTSTPARTNTGDGDVSMGAADVSAGGYLDIDVPLDDDGRLSDIDLIHEQEQAPLQGDDDDVQMEVDSSPSLRASLRARGAKAPATPKSILKRKGKAKVTASAEGDHEEETAKPSTPARPQRKLVRRFARQSTSVEPSEKDVVETGKSPSRRETARAKAQTISNTNEGADDREEGPSRKLLVRTTYGAKSRSRSRSRAGGEGRDSELEEVAVSEAKISPARSGSRGRGRPRRSVEPQDAEEGGRRGRTKARPAPARSDSRGRARSTGGGSTHPSPEAKVTRQRSSSRGRPATRQRAAHTDADEVEDVHPAKTGRAPRSEVSVVLPTLKQVRSQSLIRNEAKESPPKAAVPVDSEPAPQVSPRKRGHSVSRSAKGAPGKAASSGDVSSSPPPPPKSRRRLTETRQSDADKGVESPFSARSPSKRSAATKATKRLHDEIMPDVMNFQKELKSGHVKSTYDKEQDPAKSKGKDTDANPAKGGRKRMPGDEAGSDCSDEEREKKKQRTASGSVPKRQGRKAETIGAPDKAEDTNGKPVKSRTTESTRNIVVLTTQVSFTDDVIKVFTRLGANFTTKPSECTHLVAKNFVRTEKFLCSMAVASYVVNDKWVETSVIKGRILPEEDFPLSDPAAEAKFGVKLADVLRRAKANRGKLFQAMSFYVTPKVPVDIKLLKNVVTSGGGQLLAQTPTLRILKGHSNRYVISNPNDVSIWRPLASNGYAIYTQELILTGALRQEIDWESESYRVPGSF